VIGSVAGHLQTPGSAPHGMAKAGVNMLWPDGLTFGPDGMLYAAVARLPLAAPLNGGTRGDTQPHLLVRTRPLAPGRVG